jgi:hypothetical protein
MGSPIAEFQQVSGPPTRRHLYQALNTGRERERGVALQSNYIMDFNPSLSLLNQPFPLAFPTPHHATNYSTTRSPFPQLTKTGMRFGQRKQRLVCPFGFHLRSKCFSYTRGSLPMSALQSHNEFDGNNWISIEFATVSHIWKHLRND